MYGPITDRSPRAILKRSRDALARSIEEQRARAAELSQQIAGINKDIDLSCAELAAIDEFMARTLPAAEPTMEEVIRQDLTQRIFPR